MGRLQPFRSDCMRADCCRPATGSSRPKAVIATTEAQPKLSHWLCNISVAFWPVWVTLAFLSLMELEMADQLSTVDAAARVSHRQLLVAFGLLLFISIAALLGFGSSSVAAKGHAIWMVMPGVITTLVAVLYGMGKRIDKRSIDAV